MQNSNHIDSGDGGDSGTEGGTYGGEFTYCIYSCVAQMGSQMEWPRVCRFLVKLASVAQEGDEDEAVPDLIILPHPTYNPARCNEN